MKERSGASESMRVSPETNHVGKGTCLTRIYCKQREGEREARSRRTQRSFLVGPLRDFFPFASGFLFFNRQESAISK
jgi:hypothetical protein